MFRNITSGNSLSDIKSLHLGWAVIVLVCFQQCMVQSYLFCDHMIRYWCNVLAKLVWNLVKMVGIIEFYLLSWDMRNCFRLGDTGLFKCFKLINGLLGNSQKAVHVSDQFGKTQNTWSENGMIRGLPFDMLFDWIIEVSQQMRVEV